MRLGKASPEGHAATWRAPLDIFFVLLVLFLMFWVAPPQARGQSTFGSISGVVTDPSNAVIPGVNVTLTNLGTNGKSESATNSVGAFQFVNLLPGEYRIDVEMQGFQHFTRTPVVVMVGAAVRIDVTMLVGSVSQTVEITAATPLLQPQTSSLGEVISGNHVTDMPLNGRNVFNLMLLAPAVVPQGLTMGTPTGVNSAAWNNYQINGGFAGQSVMYLDGAPVNMSFHNNAGFIPSQNSVQEFKVQTNNMGPEWGRFSGGVMNLTTKAGANQIHGEAFEFLRNRVLNANTFYNNAANLPTSPFTQNQFGVNGGGPVYIPGVYDGRDKMFWFFSYSGFRLRRGQTWVTTVPTDQMRNGDFSNLKDASGKLIPIYDPFSVCGKFGNPACPVGSNGQPSYSRTQFQGNVIPASRISPAAAKLIPLVWPRANLPGQTYTSVNNFISNPSLGGNNNDIVARIDRNMSDKQRLFGRFLFWNNTQLPTDPLGTGECIDQCWGRYHTYDSVLDDVYTFSPKTVADFRASWLRYVYNRQPLAKSLNFDMTTLGWPASMNTQIPASYRVQPGLTVQGMANEITSAGMSVILAGIDVIDFSPSVTKMMGKHTLQVGGEYRVDRYDYGQSTNGGGSYSFDKGYTTSVPNGGTGGYSLASYLAGTPASGSQQIVTFVAAQQVYRALYAGDTWRVTRKLTLNEGLRYELQGPWTERFNNLSAFDPSAPSTLQVSGLSLRGQYGVVASALQPSRSNFRMDKKQFSPRVGFAYQINNDTVLRGGYGIFYIANMVDNSGLPNNDPMNSVSTPMVASLDGGISPYNTFNNPYPNGLIVPNGRPANPDQFCLNLGGCSAFINDNPYAYMQQWNVNLQRQLPAGLFVDVAYAGSKGTHLPGSRQMNQLPDQYLSLGSALNKSVANPFFGLITSGPMSTATVAQGQLLRPYPQYGSFSAVSSGFGQSIYHSLQLKVVKRFKKGGSFLASYTNAKFISMGVEGLTSWLEASTGGQNGVQDWNNIRAGRTLTSADISQRLVVSYNLDLPFGTGQAFLSGAHGVAGKIVSGWGLSGIVTMQTGFPLKFHTSSNLTNSYGGGSYPNVTCSADSQITTGSAEERLTRWFNTSCFSAPAAYTFGNEPRVDPVLRQHGIKNVDFTLFKTTNFGPENRLGLQFRAEVFNLFNHPQFGPPGTTTGNPQLGIVSSQVNDPRLIQFALRFLY